MEGFEKGLFPSNSPKSTGFGENNENDSTQDKMIPKFQNHKKTVTKNFMSPTISAASKAAAPRRKILEERKENLGNCDVLDHKMFNLNLKNSPQISISYRNVPSRDLVSESEDDGDIKFSDDSSGKGYDPLKNYLSPRPKYLRFNPNRHRQIIERLERREGRDELNSSSESLEVNEEQDSSLDGVEDSRFSPRKESVVGPESGEKTEEDDVGIDHEEDEEEEDEDEEEKGWCLGGVLKVVLTLIACLLSNSYICSMNSPTPSPTQQAIWNLRDGYLMIQRQTLEFVNMKMQNAGVYEVEVGDVYEEIEEKIEAEIVADDFENLERHENDEDKDYIAEDAEFGTDETTIYADSLKEENNANKIEDLESEIIGGGGVESETHNTDQLMDSKADESGDAGGSVLVMDIGGPNQLHEIELSMKSASEETLKVSKTVGNTDSSQVVIGFHEKLTDSVSEVDEMEGSNLSESVPEETPMLEELVPSHEKSTDYSVDEIVYGNEEELGKKAGWNTSAAVFGIVAAASLLSALLAAVYHSKKTRSPSAKESKSILKPHKFASEATKVVDKKVEFLARPSSPPRSTEEARKELSHRLYAPSVELIGEIEVGGRKSYIKYGTEFEESNATFSTPTKQNTPSIELIGEIEVGGRRSYEKYETKFEESNATFSTPTKQQSVATSLPSYGGNFTNDRKILKKEGEGQVGGDATPTITPVRRSSRLRNRAAVTMSPY